MGKREIDPEKRREVQKLSTRIVLAMTILIICYVVYALITKNLNIIVFEIMLGAFIVVYMALNDVIEPKRLGLFENMTIGQREAYTKIILLDVVGIGALLYWIMGMGKEGGSESIFPVLIYFLTAQMKRKFRPDFEGTADEEEEKEEAVEEPAEIPGETEDNQKEE